MSDVRVRATAIAVAIAAADQLADWAVRHEAGRLPWTFGRQLAIRLAHNTGISFSRLAGGGMWLLVLITLVCGALALAVWRAPARFAVPLSIVLGGAVGNLIDRWRFGYVIDYVGVGPWPTFNLGDVAIAVGAVLIGVAVLRPPPGSRSTPET
jgi:lipoprotein signal peptidase